VLEPVQQAAELILPAKHALNGIEAFLEYVSIEQRLPPRLVDFPPPGLALILGTMPRLKIAFRFGPRS
jgi:hypothetical protein